MFLENILRPWKETEACFLNQNWIQGQQRRDSSGRKSQRYYGNKQNVAVLKEGIIHLLLRGRPQSLQLHLLTLQHSALNKSLPLKSFPKFVWSCPGVEWWALGELWQYAVTFLTTAVSSCVPVGSGLLGSVRSNKREQGENVTRSSENSSIIEILRATVSPVIKDWSAVSISMTTVNRQGCNNRSLSWNRVLWWVLFFPPVHI